MKETHQNGQFSREDRIDSFDKAIDSCENIEALANLLAGYSESAVIEGSPVARGGHLIAIEIEKLRDALEALNCPPPGPRSKVASRHSKRSVS